MADGEVKVSLVPPQALVNRPALRSIGTIKRNASIVPTSSGALASTRRRDRVYQVQSRDSDLVSALLRICDASHDQGFSRCT